MMCEMKNCIGSGSPILVDGKAELHLCPRHAIEVRDFGFDVTPLTAQPWLIAGYKAMPESAGANG